MKRIGNQISRTKDIMHIKKVKKDGHNIPLLTSHMAMFILVFLNRRKTMPP